LIEVADGVDEVEVEVEVELCVVAKADFFVEDVE
jgi:hypothetical protein